jgi:hypothetical protein
MPGDREVGFGGTGAPPGGAGGEALLERRQRDRLQRKIWTVATVGHARYGIGAMLSAASGFVPACEKGRVSTITQISPLSIT